VSYLGPIKEVQDANLYSLMTVTTPDTSQKDRLAVCVRYIK